MTSAPATPLRLLLVGVGGQGCVTAGRVVGAAAIAEGLDARVGELHGLSQRGGSVQCTVAIGPGRTARIERGEADALVALEPLEALRALPYVSGRTRVLVNLSRIVPFLLTFKGQEYPSPEEVLDRLRAAAGDVVAVDGSGLAEGAGGAQSVNVVMLGALAAVGALPFPGEALRRVVERTSPARSLETNRRAFDLGRGALAGRSIA
jgi:indolepyruvate ferredoxin oxidoreductase beta subunit